MKKMTAVLIGAGQRGVEAYSSYALLHPNELQVVAVAEPRAERRKDFADLHNIEEGNRFSDYRELFKRGKLADCAFICTQDNMHFEPAMEALKAGYDLLVEKPVSKNPEELKKLAEAAEKAGRRVSVCHVLRYSPFYTKLKELIDGGAAGEVAHIVQTECIGYWHFAHSYVRGNWRNEALSSPIILAKSCHDLDILVYLTGRKPLSVQSVGSLTHFKAANAPQGSPAYCLDGCPQAATCPYNIEKLYLRDERWIDSLRKIATGYEDVKRALPLIEHGQYGRCVYRCDNDVPDSQTSAIEFEGGVTATFALCAFTKSMTRTVNIMGSRGQIVGDMAENKITVYDFASGNRQDILINTPEAGHNGSDAMLMRDLLEKLRGGGKLKTDIGESLISHYMALAAEQSRKEGKKILLNEFIGR